MLINFWTSTLERLVRQALNRGGEIDRQADRQKDRQIDKETETLERQRQREKEERAAI